MSVYKGMVVGAKIVAEVTAAGLGFRLGEYCMKKGIDKYRNSKRDAYKAWKRGRKTGNYEELDACFE